MTAQHEAIIREIYEAVERFGGSRELLAVIGSWGDTLSDEEVLEALIPESMSGAASSPSPR